MDAAELARLGLAARNTATVVKTCSKHRNCRQNLPRSRSCLDMAARACSGAPACSKSACSWSRSMLDKCRSSIHCKSGAMDFIECRQNGLWKPTRAGKLQAPPASISSCVFIYYRLTCILSYRSWPKHRLGSNSLGLPPQTTTAEVACGFAYGTSLGIPRPWVESR